MSQASPLIQHVTEGGIAAEHIPLPAPQALVAPALTEKEHNAIKLSLVPFACWRASDMRFEFESSFVRPEIAADIPGLKGLIDKHTLANEKGEPAHKPPLTVFGHADPTGSDDFNKSLSGRRAQAIYAMLIRKVDLWEDLYSHPLGNDKWEPKAIHAMQAALGRPLSDKPTAAQRKALFKDYMDHVCTIRDDTGQPVPDDKGQAQKLELKPADFLAGGGDSGGKGDFQGCGEFNPVLVFSQEENKRFSEPENKPLRDAENALNRRVLVFLFRPGVRIDPNNWPCPRAKEGVAACKKRFWSDGEKRRSNQDERREFETTNDTFACRFYQRLIGRSPCEQAAPFKVCHFSHLLRSNSGGVPLSNRAYKIHLSPDRVLKGKTDADGRLGHENIPPGEYEMEVEGFTGVTTIPALPTEVKDHLHRVEGLSVFDAALEGATGEVVLFDDNEISGPGGAQGTL